MMKLMVVLWLLCFWTATASRDQDLSVQKEAMLLAEKYHDKDRSKLLDNVLASASGIYKDKTRVKSPRLKKTILLNVVESSGHRWNPSIDEKYKQQLYNHLCFTKQLGLETVVYLIKDHQAAFDQDVKDMRSIDSDLNILDYPYELFWRTISKKRGGMKSQGGVVDYQGTIPTYKHFGFLVTLIPILEALLAGYNVIYFDVDVALMRDPLPYMITGTADFIVSPEMRSCVYPSLQENRNKLEYHNYEANTGTMHIRSNNRTIHMFQEWVRKIVDDNVNNDQKALNFKNLKAQQTYDCNDHAQKFLPPLTTPYGAEQPKFCFLNELLFQNGKLAFNCAFDKFGSRSELLLAMAAARYDGYGAHEPSNRLQSPYVVNELPLLLDEAARQRYLTIAPATVHANFCDNKAHCLDSVNLWILQTNKSSHSTDGVNFNSTQHYSCKAYNISDTFYGKIDWQSELKIIKKEVDSMAALPNGTVFRIQNRKRLFLIGDGAIHEFYDRETLETSGFKMENVISLKPFSYFMNFTTGRLIG